MRTVEGPITKPLYSVQDAARFVGVRPERLQRWVTGYTRKGVDYGPVVIPPPDRSFAEVALSFTNLIEAAVVGACLHKGLSLHIVRLAYEQGIAEFGEHPFARQDLFLSGKDLFIGLADQADTERDYAVLTKPGQKVFPSVIHDYLLTLDFADNGLPTQWRPRAGHNEARDEDVVKLHPEIQFGLPAVRGIRTEVLVGRFSFGESVSELAEDFDLQQYQVEQAIRYEQAITHPWMTSQAA